MNYIGTYLSIEFGCFKTKRYTKSKQLYPDERTEHYDGGTLIYTI